MQNKLLFFAKIWMPSLLSFSQQFITLASHVFHNGARMELWRPWRPIKKQQNLVSTMESYIVLQKERLGPQIYSEEEAAKVI